MPWSVLVYAKLVLVKNSMRKRLVFGVCILFFTLLFLLVNSTEVHAAEWCDEGEPTEAYCTDPAITTKAQCLGCGTCEWVVDEETGSTECRAVKRVGVQCGLYLTQEECNQQQSSSPGVHECAWKSAEQRCVHLSGGGSLTDDSCRLLDDWSHGIRCDQLYGSARTVIGHDVWCGETSSTTPKEFYYGEEETPSCYQPASGGFAYAIPRNETINNCTCYNTLDYSDTITSPLICVSFDLRYDYNCPPGYTFLDVHCVADLDNDNHFGETVFSTQTPYIDKPNTCDDFCTYLTPDECSAYSDLCMIENDAYCYSINSFDGDQCSEYADSATCKADADCGWKPLLDPDLRCVSTGVNMGKVGEVNADDCDDNNPAIWWGNGCGSTDCYPDVDKDDFGNETVGPFSLYVSTCDQASPCGSHIGAATCNSLPECSWSTTTGICVQVIDCSQHDGDHSSCTSTPGCYWDSSMYCDGGSQDCGTYPSTCSGNPGCGSGLYNLCEGNPTNTFFCSDVLVQDECEGLEGCQWSTTSGTCQSYGSFSPQFSCTDMALEECPTAGGFNAPCDMSTYSTSCEYDCSTGSNQVCAPSTFNPTGNYFCVDVLTQAECDDLDSCMWDGGECKPVSGVQEELHCSTTPALFCPDDTLTSPCSLQTQQTCTGGSWDCNEYSNDPDSCESRSGCDWQETDGQCKNYVCGSKTDMASCEELPSCDWLSTGNSCQGDAPVYVVDNTDCLDSDPLWNPSKPFPPNNCEECEFNFSAPTPLNSTYCSALDLFVSDLSDYLSTNVNDPVVLVDSPTSDSSISTCYIKNGFELWCLSSCTSGPGLITVQIHFEEKQGECASPIESLSVNVVEDNTCPTMTSASFPARNACNDSAWFDADDYASDPDNQPLSYNLSASSDPTIATFSEDEGLLFIDAQSTGGPVGVWISAYDGLCYSDAAYYDVANLLNTPPLFAAGLVTEHNFSTAHGPMGDGYYFIDDLSSYGQDADGDDLSYALDESSTNSSIGDIILSYGSFLFFKPLLKGTTTVDVLVQDCIDNDVETITFNVLNTCANMSALPTNYYLSNNSASHIIVNLSAYVTDMDGDNLTYTITPIGSPQNATCTIQSGELISCSPVDVGNQSFDVFADDGDCIQSKEIQVEVYDIDTCHLDADDDSFGNQTESIVVSGMPPDYCENIACTNFTNQTLCEQIQGCSWAGSCTGTAQDYISIYSMYRWPTNNLGQTEGSIIWDCDDSESELTYLCCSAGSHFVWQRSTYKGDTSHVDYNDYPKTMAPATPGDDMANYFIGACCASQTDCVYGEAFYDNGQFWTVPNPNARCWPEGTSVVFSGNDDSDTSMYCGDD